MSSVLSISEEQLEKLVVNRFYTSQEYQPVIFEHYKKEILNNENLREIMAILCGFYDKFGKMPSKEVLKNLVTHQATKKSLDTKKLELELDSVLSVDYKEDEKFVKESIGEFIKVKNCYALLMESYDDVMVKRDVAKVLSKLQKVINIEFDQNLGLNYFKDIDKHWDYITNPEMKQSTGFDQIDKITFGGFPKGGKCLAVFLGQPGLGKSLMLGNLAVNYILQDLGVVIITLELCEDLYAKRIDAHLSSVGINSLQHSDEALNKIKGIHKIHPKSNLYIKEYPPGTVNSIIIKNYIKKLKDGGAKIDVIIVDYLNLMVPNHKAMQGGTYEKVGTIVQELRALSYDFECPVFSASQVNRCLTLDSKVILLEGEKELETNIVNLNIGDKIKSKNGFNTVTNKYDIEKQKVYKITTKSGKIIKCSKKHIFPTSEKEKSIESGLTIGDKLIINNISNTI